MKNVFLLETGQFIASKIINLDNPLSNAFLESQLLQAESGTPTGKINRRLIVRRKKAISEIKDNAQFLPIMVLAK